LLSGAAWLATVWLVWRALRRLGAAVDAAVVAVLLLGIPGLVIASSMMTNDALCALFVTATLVRLLEAPPDTAPKSRHVALTATLASLAAISKVTGAAAIAMAAAFYAWQSRRSLSSAVRSVLIVGAVTAVIAVPHYARLLLLLSGPAYHIIGGRAGSQEREFVGHVVLAAMTAGNRLVSLPGLFHMAVWGDPAEAFLPRDLGMPLTALWWAGVLVPGVVALGAMRLLVERDVARRAGWVLSFGMIYALALVPPTVAGPYLMLTKITYLLPVVLPVAIVLAAGLAAGRHLGTVLGAAFLAIAAAGVALTWYGWWAPGRPATTAIEMRGAAGSPEFAIRRYFAERVDDPIRAVAVLAPSAQLAHELRVVRILRLPFTPEPSPLPGDVRSLEIARARVAWLELHHLVRWMQPMLSAMDVGVLDVRQDGTDTEVATRIGAVGTVAPPGTTGMGLWPFPPFEQRFGMQHEGGAWRITRIVQSGVSAENAVQAFVANPTLAGLDDLRALGWRPEWDDAMALTSEHAPGATP
jgi:hypothetical protein